MRNLFFGAGAAVGWFLAASVFAFCAAYVWQIVREVGGVRGTALATMCTSLAIICCCFGLILAHVPWLPSFVLGAIVTAAFPPIVFAALVLVDLYSADRNSHRSFTARSYSAYRRWVEGDHEDSERRAPISLGSGGGKGQRNEV